MQVEPPTLALGVPTIWMGLIQAYDRALTEQPGRWKLPAGMRSLVGGAAVPEALIRAFARHGVWIIQGWGMTETSPLATISYLRSRAEGRRRRRALRRAAMAGVPAPLVDVRIRGDDGTDAPWDGKTMGEIQVRGPFITGSYHEVPVRAEKFTDDGWLRTGDVATMDELALRAHHRPHQGPDQVGRRMDQLGRPRERADGASGGRGSGGDRDPRREVERAAAGLHRVQAGQASAAERIADEFGAHLLRHGFARWQVPDRYEVIDAVPRTSTGKFWKLKLRERFPR